MAAAYSHDIQPKFRPQDVNCMSRRGIALSDPQWMCAAGSSFGYADHGNARHVFDRLSDGSMPPDTPWTQDWLDTYQAWMDTGFTP